MPPRSKRPRRSGPSASTVTSLATSTASTSSSLLNSTSNPQDGTMQVNVTALSSALSLAVQKAVQDALRPPPSVTTSTNTASTSTVVSAHVPPTASIVQSSVVQATQAIAGTSGGKIQPRDLKLSDVMATSAAALALYMGVYDVMAETVRNLQMVLGVHFGKSLISDPSRDVAGSTISCCRFLPIIIQLFIVVPVILPPFLSDDWHVIVVAWYLSVLLVVLMIAALPTGRKNGGFVEKFVRWCVVNIYHVRFSRLFLQTVDLGPVPPAVLNLSDGGHVEDLGLLALLKKKLRKIVVVDGTTRGQGQPVSLELQRSLELARRKLRCSFSAIDGRDIAEDLRCKLDEMPDNYKPRFYKFRVEYFEKKPNSLSDEKVGEGEVLLILPRHPNEGTCTSADSRRTWQDYARHTKQPMSNKHWGAGPDLEAGEVDQLTGCCCECCHVTCCKACCGIFCGTFPHHVTLNQFFTPAMFSAYHREGYRACLDAELARFFSETETGEER